PGAGSGEVVAGGPDPRVRLLLVELEGDLVGQGHVVAQVRQAPVEQGPAAVGPGSELGDLLVGALAQPAVQLGERRPQRLGPLVLHLPVALLVEVLDEVPEVLVRLGQVRAVAGVRHSLRHRRASMPTAAGARQADRGRGRRPARWPHRTARRYAGGRGARSGWSWRSS